MTNAPTVPVTLSCPTCDQPVTVIFGYEAREHRIIVSAASFDFSCGGHDQ